MRLARASSRKSEKKREKNGICLHMSFFFTNFAPHFGGGKTYKPLNC